MKTRFTLLMAAFTLSCVTSTFAQTESAITVENHSFELPGTGKIQVKPDGSGTATDWSGIPGWDSDMGTTQTEGENGVEGSISDGSSFATDGDFNAFLDSSSIYQLTDHVIAAGDIFTLTADVSSSWKGEEGIKLELYYDNDGEMESMGDTIYMFEEGASKDGPHTVDVTISADDIAASIGNKIGIRFSNTDPWVAVDNVSLSVQAFPTSINDLVRDDAKIYPNVVEDAFNISSSDVTNVEIFNISGRLVKSTQVNSSRVNVSELANGVYMVKLIGFTTSISKFVKQ